MDEEMELEEGEAYYFHHHGDNNNNSENGYRKWDDNGVDRRIDFSYMDMKVQDVLGHFQKDFEGVVSAENLGSKFGEYGSFLPAYQRSLVCSLSKPSPNPLVEGPHCNCNVSVTASKPQRQGHAQTATTAVSRGKQRPINSSENSFESADRKSSSSFRDQKTLKVRIKLGSSDNLSVQEKASTPNKVALYAGLGLDASPSTSMDESPCESEEMSQLMDMGFESPTSILQVMTSLPLNGDRLLSPLSGDLIQLGDKKRTLEEQTDKRLFGGKLPRLSQRKDASNSKDIRGSHSKKSKRKDLDADSLADKDLTAETFQLPIISAAEGNGTSSTIQSFSAKGKDDSMHSACRDSDDKVEAHEPEGSFREKSVSSTERVSSRDKKRVKGCKSGVQLADPANESFDDVCPFTVSKKRIKEDISRSGSESGELKLRKMAGKGRDIYTDLCGETEHDEQSQNEVMGFSPVENNNKLKERSDVSLNFAPLAPAAAPFMIKENWVCCDKCQKWRLLPVGKDPESLPKKWICSMLDWLPGKNRCSVSEVETNAILSQSYALAPNSQNIPLNVKMRTFPSASTAGNVKTCVPETPSAVGTKKQHIKEEAAPNIAGTPAVPGHSSKPRDKPRTCENQSDEAGAGVLKLSKKARHRDIQSGDEDRSSSGGSASRKPGKNGDSNDIARILNSNSVDEIPKPRSEAPEKVNSDSENSVLKKSSHSGHKDPGRDKDEHIKRKKARVPQIEGKDLSEQYASDGALNSIKKEQKDPRFSLQPTSSSYNANKSKCSFREVKGSPVESVSSSPMRSSKPDVLSRNEDREKSRSFKNGWGDKRKESDAEVKVRDSERKRLEDDHRKAGKNDAVGKPHGSEQKSSRRDSSSRNDQTQDDTHIRKSKGLPPSGAIQTETPPVSIKPPSVSPKTNKGLKPSDSSGSANGMRQQSDRKDNFSLVAANAIKEAKDLKHMADRVKASGSNLEGTSLYFQAALKFLHGASLLESSFNTSLKYAEMVQSEQTYSSTAKLFEFCAREYEKFKEMASSALAYKCMEVAYMKVVYSSQNFASKDRHELQTTLKLISLGESPSSSASGVDHVNNTTAADNKAMNSKDENSAQVASTHIITAQNRANFGRLLNYAHNANNAMEASRRSMAAFNAAISKSTDVQYREVMSCIKQAIDFNFQSIDDFLKLVRIATEAINR